MSDLLKKKSSFGVLPKELIAQTKAPPTEQYSLSRTNAIREKRTIRGATLKFTVTRALGGDTIISPGN
jgi:hypothetical protein